MPKTQQAPADPTERLSVDSFATVDGDGFGTRINYSATRGLGDQKWWLEFQPRQPRKANDESRWSEDDLYTLRGGTYTEVLSNESMKFIIKERRLWFGRDAGETSEAQPMLSVADVEQLTTLLQALLRRIEQDRRNPRLARALVAADEVGQEFLKLSSGRAR